MNLEELRKNYPQLSDDAIADLAGLSMRLSGGKTRKNFLGLVKEVAPETPIPEIDAKAEFEAALAKEREAREKLEKQLAEKDFASSLASQKKDAMDKYGLAAEDVTKMEEMMKKGELPADYKWAAPLFKEQIQVATPTSYESSYLGLQTSLKQPGFEGLLENPDEWSRQMADRLIEEGNKRRPRGF